MATLGIVNKVINELGGMYVNVNELQTDEENRGNVAQKDGKNDVSLTTHLHYNVI